MSAPHSPHWLDQYGNPDAHAWKTSTTEDGHTTLYRPLGLVEYAFDSDGRYYEGRADLNVQLDLTIRSNLSHEQLRERILLAWTLFRCEHPLAQSKALERQSYMDDPRVATPPIYCVVDVPENDSVAIANAQESLIFLEDHFSHVDAYDFWMHAQNSARVVDAAKSLSKCFVYPFTPPSQPGGLTTLRFLAVIGHQITDGLTNYTWMRSFIHLLNRSLPDLHSALSRDITPTALLSRLPPPQESLYPLITGSLARKRWFWALTRILRHVRKPHRAGFSNPLRRATPIKTSPPPTNLRPSPRLHPPPTPNNPPRLRQSPPSRNRPPNSPLSLRWHTPLSDRKPFITGFPLNPRPFLREPVQAESLMLAFSDGIELPFLPSYLPLENRLKLLAKRAQKQLAVYQKREALPSADDAGAFYYMGSRGPGRMLQTQYLGSLERANEKIPEQFRGGVKSPQGAYPMRPNATMQTCGVSSVGRRDAFIGPGMYDVKSLLGQSGKDFVADFKDIDAAVRARDGEFLIGVWGTESGLGLTVSADASTLDPELMKSWQARLRGIFEELEGEERKKRSGGASL
ncbi:hypothetical protein Q7P36_004421 [Cladosporium allicinum]